MHCILISLNAGQCDEIPELPNNIKSDEPVNNARPLTWKTEIK